MVGRLTLLTPKPPPFYPTQLKNEGAGRLLGNKPMLRKPNRD